ncbi:MAG: hypothetical protein IJT49_00350 [Clostridia bacterium]|nr:hypothetical protein [Clostridia bacterium]
MAKSIKYVLTVVLIGIFTAYLLFFGAQSKKDAAEGLSVCGNVILTTVFPFSVAAQLLITSGVCGRLGSLIKAPASFLFGLSPAGAGVLLLGFIGGYPSGASGASELYKRGEISKDEAEVVISYTNNATPAFMINFIGLLSGSSKLGLICYLINILSALLWAFILRKKTGKRCVNQTKNNDFSFISAVTSSAFSTVYVCAFVIIFSVISGAFSRLPLPYISLILPSLFEITTGAVMLSGAGLSVRITAAALCAAASFSGLCVASQVFSAAENAGFCAKYYIPGKIFQAFVSFFALYLIYPFITY